MTEITQLLVDNPLCLFDGCWVKLSDGKIDGPIFWDIKLGLFFLANHRLEWTASGSSIGQFNNIISLAPTPREPVKVPNPWMGWQNVYGDVLSTDMHPTLETAISRRVVGFTYIHEIECRVVRVHFPDGTTQEVK